MNKMNKILNKWKMKISIMKKLINLLPSLKSEMNFKQD
jgi:hypothetical protein